MFAVGCRLATAPGTRNRATVVVTTDFEVWVGNETTSEIVIKNSDIFGFHAGDFDVKMVSGVLPHYPASFESIYHSMCLTHGFRFGCTNCW